MKFNKNQYTSKATNNSIFFDEVLICDYTNYEKFKNRTDSKINENVYLKLPLEQLDANCVMLYESDLFVSLSEKDLVTEKTIANLESQIVSKKLKRKRLEQIKVKSGHLGIFFIGNGKKRTVKKIKYKIPQSICIVTKCFDESYKFNETRLNAYNKRLDQLEREIKFNQKKFPEKVDKLVEEIIEVSESQLSIIKGDMMSPNLGFLRIYIHKKKQL